MKKILQEFKQFAMRGNVIDMAVGIIIGGAFGLTEPGAGTDAQGQQTKAVLDGDEVPHVGGYGRRRTYLAA